MFRGPGLLFLGSQFRNISHLDPGEASTGQIHSPVGRRWRHRRLAEPYRSHQVSKPGQQATAPDRTAENAHSRIFSRLSRTGAGRSPRNIQRASSHRSSVHGMSGRQARISTRDARDQALICRVRRGVAHVASSKLLFDRHGLCWLTSLKLGSAKLEPAGRAAQGWSGSCAERISKGKRQDRKTR